MYMGYSRSGPVDVVSQMLSKMDSEGYHGLQLKVRILLDLLHKPVQKTIFSTCSSNNADFAFHLVSCHLINSSSS